MNLLIVDDEQLEIEGIKATVDFTDLGVESIFEANSMRQAKEIFSRNRVDILLCDIEMPQNNGFELLAWVNEAYPNTCCVFITCHADFHYAKQAIRLGSMDYLLKPAQPEELRRVVGKAAEALRATDRMRHDMRLGNLWLDHQSQIVEHFWLDILKNKIAPNKEKMKRAAELLGLQRFEKLTVFPILIRIQRRAENMGTGDERLMEYALKNIAQEMLLAHPQNGVVIDMEENGILAILNVNTPALVNAEQSCGQFIEACREYIDCELSCYLGRPVFPYELSAVVHSLLELDKNNVVETNSVFRLDSFSADASAIPTPDMSLWMLLIDRNQKERLVSEIEQYFQFLLKQKHLNAEILYRIKLDFMQMIGSFIKAKGIQPYRLFDDPVSVELLENCTKSVGHMKRCILHGTTTALKCIDEIEKSHSKIEKVKQYISQNLDQDLTNEKIAAQIFLNPVYLNRIFKKETGLTISDYLQQERINKSTELLVKTDMPVNMVALQIGYSNFSYFSRIFRKQTGLSPIDYRKKHTAAK